MWNCDDLQYTKKNISHTRMSVGRLSSRKIDNPHGTTYLGSKLQHIHLLIVLYTKRKMSTQIRFVHTRNYSDT